MIPTAEARDTSLDFWRGVGVFLVLMHHFLFFHFSFLRDFVAAGASGTYDIVWQAGKIIFKVSELAGPLGVKIFFVVSGYIITKLMLREEVQRGTLNVYAFYIRRIFRIVPAYAFYLLSIVMFVILNWISVAPGDIGHAASFLCNSGVDCGWFVSHTWTLGVEMQFYLFWPLLFILVPQRHRPLFLVGVIALLLSLSANGILLARGWIDNALSLSCIALGALYAASVQGRAVVERYGFFGIIIAVVAVGGFVVAGLHEPARVIYHMSVPFIILIVLFAVPRWDAFQSSWVFLTLSRVGLVSYSLYLWQEVFAAPTDLYLSSSPLQYSAVLVAITLFSYFFIELPGIRLGKNILARRAGSGSSS